MKTICLWSCAGIIIYIYIYMYIYIYVVMYIYIYVYMRGRLLLVVSLLAESRVMNKERKMKIKYPCEPLGACGPGPYGPGPH